MPIVSPWIFYLINTISNLSGALILIVLVSAGIAVTAWLISLIEDEKTATIKKWMRRAYTSLIFCIISLIVMVFIPSQETMYQMLVANYVTYENVETATDAIKDSVDYIFDKLNEEEE